MILYKHHFVILTFKLAPSVFLQLCQDHSDILNVLLYLKDVLEL